MLDSSELLILAQLLNNILKKQKGMKKLKLLIVGIILLLSSSASAQVSVNLNIGTESSWHPYESWENNGYSNITTYRTLSVIMM
jgi:hypothetical protein